MSVVEEDDANAMGCDAAGCDRWYHYDCIDSEARAFADLSLIENTDWLCEWCTSRIERVCEICMSRMYVVDDVAKGLASGWVRCENAMCERWYHLDCLPADERRMLERGQMEWMCNACFVCEA